MEEFQTITEKKAIRLIMKNCVNPKCIYRLSKKNKNNYLSVTVDNVYDANFISFYWLESIPKNTWAVNNNTLKTEHYNIS